MILLAVVMGHRSRPIARRELPDVAEATVDQGEHVLRRLPIEHVPVAATRDVNRRGVRQDASRPDVVMRNRAGIAGTAGPRGEPGVAVDREPGFETQTPRAALIAGRRDDLPLLNDLERVDREDRLRLCFDLDRPTVTREMNGVADRVPVDGEPDDRAAGPRGTISSVASSWSGWGFVHAQLDCRQFGDAKLPAK